MMTSRTLSRSQSWISAVQLDDVRPQIGQTGEARIAGGEVVQRDLEATMGVIPG
jgi:hypothetical protein